MMHDAADHWRLMAQDFERQKLELERQLDDLGPTIDRLQNERVAALARAEAAERQLAEARKALERIDAMEGNPRYVGPSAGAIAREALAETNDNARAI